MKYIGTALGLLQIFLMFFWAFKQGIRTVIGLISIIISILGIIVSSKYLAVDGILFVGIALTIVILAVAFFLYMSNLDRTAKDD